MAQPRKIKRPWTAIAREPLKDLTFVLGAQDLAQLVLGYAGHFQECVEQMFNRLSPGIDCWPVLCGISPLYEVPRRDVSIIRNVLYTPMHKNRLTLNQ